MGFNHAEDFLERLRDPEYAKLYGEEDAKLDFAITLTKARKSLNLTQKGLAEKLYASQPYVAKLEAGEANPTLSAIGRLRLVTGTSPLVPETSRESDKLLFSNSVDAGFANMFPSPDIARCYAGTANADVGFFMSKTPREMNAGGEV
jgi:transcriptional regulator with XRE-family HTH domain